MVVSGLSLPLLAAGRDNLNGCLLKAQPAETDGLLPTAALSSLGAKYQIFAAGYRAMAETE
jgi:hypothetical protein